ncbi:MAG: VCBS repeat-containing protein [Ferruginibacter sp.]|nr:VCBS repeat-containing protein [Ferruginibacter sp.]
MEGNIKLHSSNPNDASKGALLFTQYCGSCHLHPDPKHLTKTVWQNQVLPIMAIKMGLIDDSYDRKITEEEKRIEKENHLIPEQPMISKKDFEAITSYIVSESPDSVTIDLSRLKRNATLKNFVRKDIPLGIQGPSLITALNYDNETKTLWIGSLNKQVLTWKYKEGIVTEMSVASPVVHFSFFKGSAFLTEIGDLFPSEISRGTFAATNATNEAPLLSKLHRPVFSVLEDFDGTGLPEVLICNFGKNLGSLSLYRRENNASPFVEQVLLPVAGATKCFVRDMNGDGLKDIVALMAQGDESVYILYNRGGLKFDAKRVLHFPPDYGTTDMVLTDFNHDGKVDIITAHGDNADYSNIPKAYHGIRLHINNGNNEFTERFFYPVYGVTKLLAEDFDKDGDIDIAAASFYAEYGRLKDESFIYLENRDSKKYTFKSYTHHSEVPVKSLTMETADIDNDGDTDIILGNFAFSPVSLPNDLKTKWESANYGLIIFENQLYH